MENVKPISDLWNIIVNYIGVTQGGISLSGRLRFLIQAKVGLKNGIKMLEQKNCSYNDSVMNNPVISIREILDMIVVVDRLINMVRTIYVLNMGVPDNVVRASI